MEKLSTIEELISKLGNKNTDNLKIFIMGGSCSGKTYLKNKLIEKGYKSDVSYTTRKKRDDEVDGEDYHFISKDEFLHLIDENYFIQYNHFNGEYYGTSYDSINNNNVFIITPNSLKIIIDKIGDKIDYTVIFTKCSGNTTISRMKDRGYDDMMIFKRIKADNETFKGMPIEVADFMLET